MSRRLNRTIAHIIKHKLKKKNNNTFQQLL